MSWLSDRAVQNEIVKITRDREVGVLIAFDKEDKPIANRRLYANGTDQFKTILRMMKYDKEEKKVSFFVGSNRIKLKSLEMPMLHKCFTPEWKAFKQTWNANVGNADVYFGKNLIWDFDEVEKPMEAFELADGLCAYLDKQGFNPMMVFSGNKGFHVWLSHEESKTITNHDFSDFTNTKDNARELGHFYAETVQRLLKEATGEELMVCDLSPVQRQGLIRCPYTIHPKTGQIVYPLNKANLDTLRGLSEDVSALDIAKAIHPWESPSENSFSDAPLYHPPMSQIFNRGMPVWEA